MQLTQSLAPFAVMLGLTQAIPQPHHHAVASRDATAFDPSTASLDEFASYALKTAKARIANSTGTCTTENVTVRKLAENLTGEERTAYTSALNCLMNLPAKTPSSLAAGAKTRYDDWVVTHINQTLTIHSTVSIRPTISFFLLLFSPTASPSPIKAPTQITTRIIYLKMSCRQTSSAGTGGSFGRWNRACAMSATTPAPFPTGTGPRPPKRDSKPPRHLMALRRACLATGCP